MDILLRHDGETFRFEFRADPPAELDPSAARRLRSVLLRLAEELDGAGDPATTPPRPRGSLARPPPSSGPSRAPTFRLQDSRSGRQGAA